MTGVTEEIAQYKLIGELGRGGMAEVFVPALDCGGNVKLVAVEGKLSGLIGELALHRLDLVLSDAPLPAGSAVRGFSHLLGESGVDFFVAALARRFRPGFPGSLDGAPVLLPTEGTSLRDALRSWFERRGLKPKVVGEFEDGALLKAFGQSGRRLFPAPSAIRSEIRRQYDVQSLGRVPGVTERFFALSAERRRAKASSTNYHNTKDQQKKYKISNKN